MCILSHASFTSYDNNSTPASTSKGFIRHIAQDIDGSGRKAAGLEDNDNLGLIYSTLLA